MKSKLFFFGLVMLVITSCSTEYFFSETIYRDFSQKTQKDSVSFFQRNDTIFIFLGKVSNILYDNNIDYNIGLHKGNSVIEKNGRIKSPFVILETSNIGKGDFLLKFSYLVLEDRSFESDSYKRQVTKSFYFCR